MDELGHLHDHGVFLRREALAFGYQDRDLTRALRDGLLHRIRQGAYVASPIWSTADAEERHRLRCAAVLLTHQNRVALSHVSAAVHHGLRLWQVPMERVHVLRLDGGPGRVCGDVVYHSGGWSADDVLAARWRPSHLPGALCGRDGIPGFRRTSDGRIRRRDRPRSGHAGGARRDVSPHGRLAADPAPAGAHQVDAARRSVGRGEPVAVPVLDAGTARAGSPVRGS